ncbi:hypothetical protein KSP40_PGU009742 [Platanthera guangdongensis]|uniref:GTD-binding domain-containing protein n=1 Tax=Platanthera guangdongensis TaxID=2320717 RepID=A0ABR2MP94_9ASPA
MLGKCKRSTARLGKSTRDRGNARKAPRSDSKFRGGKGGLGEEEPAADRAGALCRFQSVIRGCDLSRFEVRSNAAIAAATSFMDVGVNSVCSADGGDALRLQSNCSCPCCGPGTRFSSALPRALKRKLEKMEIENTADVALVEIEIEAAALREAVGSQQQAIQELCSEIEEERAASSTAASEAMSMILRLQREKAETLMDARQFKRFAEEKMSHDQQEIALLEDLLSKRDEAVQSLSCELQAYRHRLLSYGIDPEPNSPTEGPIPCRNDTYPPLRCDFADYPINAGDPDLKYALGDTPRDQLQRVPSIIAEKGVVGNGYSRRCRSSSLRKDLGSNEPPFMADDMSDRVYAVDAVPGMDGAYEGTNMNMAGEFMSRRDRRCGNEEEDEIRRLYMRLQALEADRESMRKAITNIGTDKAQILLLKEIAQRLCKEATPERKIVKKSYFMRILSVMSVFKVISEFSSLLCSLSSSTYLGCELEIQNWN